MTDYILQITLQSPLTSSAGEGRVGLVDRDIAFDDLGLPILPGRRLKGLWREAYCDVVDALTLCKRKEIIDPEQIFGKIGQKHNKDEVYMHVGTAELHEPKASSLKEWLEYFQHPSIQSNLQPDDVVQHFTSVRAQTSIHRQTGTALENTYRLTRNLKAGWVFWAPVRFVEPPTEDVLTALVLGAAALQRMGIARTRGLGKVRCRFICKLTDRVLSSTTLPSISLNDSVDLSQTQKDRETELTNVTERKNTTEQMSKTSEELTTDNQCLNSTTPTHILRYQLTLREQMVILTADGDPNTVMTRQEIPGNNVLGAAAWKYLRQTDKAPEEDETFRHAFLDGGLRFLTAYPEAIDTQQRMIPIPHSIREFKKSKAAIVDFLKQPPSNLVNQPTKRLSRHHGRIDRKGLETQAVKTKHNYHHARAANDRSIGRARGNEAEDGSAFFGYVAIQADQTFQGAVLGAMCDLAKLQKWLPTGSLIRVGRSRSAQYGETEFKWIGNIKKLDKHAEWSGFLSQNPPPDLGRRLIITTLSPMLTVNDCGHPDLCFPKQELASVMGWNAVELTLSSSYTRTGVIGGYNSHLCLPKQQLPVIDAGSVFEFKLPQSLNENDQKKLLKLEQNGLGLRKNEGYGRVAVNRQGDINFTREIQLDAPEQQKRRDAPDGQITPEVQELLEGIVLRRCLVEMQAFAIKAGNLIVEQIPSNQLPSNALLGQFRIFLQQDNFDKNSKEFLNLAEEKFTKYQINIRTLRIPELQNQLTLFDLFSGLWRKRKSITRQLAGNQTKGVFESDYDNTQLAIINKLESGNNKEMCVMFYNHLLTALHREPQLQKTETQ